MAEHVSTEQAKQRVLQAALEAQLEAGSLTLRAPLRTLAAAFTVGMILGAGSRMRGVLAGAVMAVFRSCVETTVAASTEAPREVVRRHVEEEEPPPAQGYAAQRVRELMERRAAHRCRA